MNFPHKIPHGKKGKLEATAYGKSPGYPFYRISIQPEGQRRIMKSFASYAKARKWALAKMKELSKGNRSSVLTKQEADAALVIRDAIDAYHKDTGETVNPVEAVSGYLAAVRQLPEGHTLTDAIVKYLDFIGTVKAISIKKAVEAFIDSRKPTPKDKNKDVEVRPSRSPIYERTVNDVLTGFADTFVNHQVGDIDVTFLETWTKGFEGLAVKTVNSRRAILKMWLKWCHRKDHLTVNHLAKLLNADCMVRGEVHMDEPEVFTHDELRRLIDAADDDLRPVIALGAFSGLRLEEIFRMQWSDVFGTPGFIKISSRIAKTKARRLIPLHPTLRLWLQPHRQKAGRIWDRTVNSQGLITALQRLRESLDIAPRKNGLRHSWISCRLALVKDKNKVAGEAGNSPNIIDAHYRALVTPKQARAWFAIRPSKASAGTKIIKLAEVA